MRVRLLNELGRAKQEMRVYMYLGFLLSFNQLFYVILIEIHLDSIYTL